MSQIDKNKSYVRRSIENALEVAEEERRRKLLVQRLELARGGILAYKAGKVADAVRAFHAYLRILEEVKNVSEGGLMPSCFDFKREIAELLMISGIYWDLVKLYDRTRTPEKNKEFMQYLEKYIIFSKGMPYQPLCAETLRKYIQKNKPLHKTEFKNAYDILKTTRCFIASSLVDVTSVSTLPFLRDFRDYVLRGYPWGRWIILQYYRKSPKWAQRLNHWPYGIRKVLGLTLDVLAVFFAVLMNQCSNSLRSKEELTIRKTDPKR